MKLIMFSFLDELSGDGARVISALLKAEGHAVKSFYMPFFGADGQDIDWVPEAQQALEEADMYLLSVLSCYEQRAAIVTKFLKQHWPERPVVWGGVHATSLPESCLKYADFVIRGECEDAAAEFVRRYESGKDPHKTPNLCYLDDDGRMVKNDLSQLPFDLDTMPYPDYDIEDHFVLDGNRIVAADMDIYQRLHTTYFHSQPAYFVITTRGCPFVCTYCHQSEIVNTYPNREYKSRLLRYKSIDRTLEEIKFQTRRMPFLKRVGFSDDDFFCRRKDQIFEFAERYPKEIGLPFGVCAIPLSIREEKLLPLLDAGCIKFQIGIQSGSDRLNREVYQRFHPKAKLLKAIDLLDKYHDKYGFSVDVDWIIDCPWETEDDVYDSVELAMRLPNWMSSNVFTLTFYPGTAIWNRAIEEGIFDPGQNVYEQAFNMLKKEGHSYLTHVFLLHSRAKRFAPKPVMKLLMSRPARWIGERLPNWALNGVYHNRIFPSLMKMSNGGTRVEAGCQFG